MTQMRPATIVVWFVTVALGAIAGLSAGPAVKWVSHQIADIYDAQFPVVIMQGKLIAMRDNMALVRISGTKARDCKYLRIVGYVVSEQGQRRDAFIRRVSTPEAGDTKSTGWYDIGIWEIGPLDDHWRVQAETRHLCGDHEVRTIVADVRLP